MKNLVIVEFPAKEDKFNELKNLANKPFSSELLKMQDINKVEEKLASVWTKE